MHYFTYEGEELDFSQYDGVRMLDGVCRRAVYNDKTPRLSVDTPYGTEYFQVLE